MEAMKGSQAPESFLPKASYKFPLHFAEYDG